MINLTSDFSSILLTKNELKTLSILEHEPVLCNENNHIAFVRLHDLGFIVGLPEIGGSCDQISKRGTAYLRYIESVKMAKRREDIRYWITTAIAVAAFIKSFFF